MTRTLSAHEQRISQIFSDDYAFSIPGYQRPYSWTSSEAGELFDDLHDFMRDQSGPVADMMPYFLGSIVLIKVAGNPNADVIDGQQRLITLTLLLAVLRKHLGDSDAQAITGLIHQAGQAILGTADKFSLVLRSRDRSFFQEYVQKFEGLADLLGLNHGLSDSQRRLRDNARLFDDMVAKLDPAERARLAQFIVTRCFLVVVSTPDLDSAFRIFSVMNSRGLPLAATDLLKAEVIGAIPEHLRAIYTERWEAVEELLGRKEFDDLFGHIRMIYRKQKPQATLLKEFKVHVSKGRSQSALIDDVIVPLSGLWREIAHEAYTSSEHPEAVNKSLKWLNRLEWSDWAPPALAFSLRHRHEENAMIVFFADLERLAYSLLIRRCGVNERIDRFSRLTAEVESGSALDSASSALQLNGHERTATLEALDGPIYTTHSARARSTILLRLDNLLSAGGATYDYETVTVEHVVPQTPPIGSKWLAWFADPGQREEWTHRIGNLVLLTSKKNSSASNSEFEHKKAIYFTKNGVTPFALTTQVLQRQEWTVETVKHRQDVLIERLRSHWRL